MRKYLLYSTAALFFAYEQWSFYQWMQQHGTVSAGLTHAWLTLRQDPMVFMAWNDMGIFTAVVLTWLWRDLRKTGRTLAWWPASLLRRLWMRNARRAIMRPWARMAFWPFWKPIFR